MDKYEKILQLARRRGFFWQSFEIYGGVGGFMSLGPLGVALKRNIIEKWRRIFISPHQEFILEIETPIISPEVVFKASGHLEHFTDYIVECLDCGRKYRADHLIEQSTGLKDLEKYSASELTQLIRKYNVSCPECSGRLGEVGVFNLLFKTTIGPYSENIGYSRPETAQGMFINFHRIYHIARRKLPLGIAQVGKVLRNEISPRQGLIRLREFTIMELELFFDPKNPNCPLLHRVEEVKLRLLTEELQRKGVENPIEVTVREAIEENLIKNEWNAYFMALAKNFIESIGVPSCKQMFIEKLPEERAHYAAQTYDQVVQVERWGWIEVSGHAYRTDYDLKGHIKHSGKDLSAQRILKPPKIIRRIEIKPVIGTLREDFQEVVPKIIRVLKTLNPEDIALILQNKGYIDVKIDGGSSYRLTERHIAVVIKEEKKGVEHFIPHVAEPSFGVERVLYTTLEYAYSEKNGRIVLKLPRDIAPIKASVFPLVKKSELVEIALEIYEELKRAHISVTYDDEGAIGRRYMRVDEIGVPFAITVDNQTLLDNTVTVRDRDSWQQVRVHREKLAKFIVTGCENPSLSIDEIVNAIGT